MATAAKFATAVIYGCKLIITSASGTNAIHNINITTVIYGCSIINSLASINTAQGSMSPLTTVDLATVVSYDCKKVLQLRPQVDGWPLLK